MEKKLPRSRAGDGRFMLEFHCKVMRMCWRQRDVVAAQNVSLLNTTELRASKQQAL